MICDKCGFEHNSRSVCPKCGSRVIYVNEDYLRRKREWEEAQKNGRKNASMPGIMHSTREDYDRKRGRDTVTGHERVNGGNGEGRHEDAGLSFDEIKERVKAVQNRFAVFCRRFGKRRGADNPVVREIRFGEGGEPEPVGISRAARARRAFGRRSKPFLICAAVMLVLLAAGALVAVNLLKKNGSGRVFIYDGRYGYYADDENNRLLGETSGNLVITTGRNGCFAACDDGRVYVCRDGRVTSVDAAAPRIITCNDSMSLVVYESGGAPYILSGENSIRLAMENSGDFTDACAVSDSGGYFVLTACAGGEDFTTGEYALYIGNSAGELREISRNRNDKEIVTVRDDGRIIFSDLATADYGIINGRTLSVWENDAGRVATVIEEVYGLGYDEKDGAVYCLTGDKRLYRWDVRGADPVLLDDEVDALCANALFDGQGGALYRKDDGFYVCENGKNPRYLFDAHCTSPEFYCDYSRNYLYYRDMGAVYYVGLKGEERVPRYICTPQSPEALIYNPAGKSLLVIASDGLLWELGASQRQFDSFASCISAVENDDGYAYCSGGLLVYGGHGKKSVTLAEGVDSFDRIGFAKGRIYYRTEDGTLYRVAPDGSKRENLGYAENVIFVQ